MELWINNSYVCEFQDFGSKGASADQERWNQGWLKGVKR